MFSRRIDEDLELRLPLEQSAEESARLVQENLAHLGEWLAWVRADLTVEDSRSEEHTSELQSRQYLVCRLLFEKKLPLLNPSRQSALRSCRIPSCVSLHGLLCVHEWFSWSSLCHPYLPFRYFAVSTFCSPTSTP